MGATTNCTVVHYGTTWDDTSLLESIKQTNLELQKKDGFIRNFKFDYLHVGQYNLAYRLYVETERERLGENHPLFLTQYRLMPLHGGGGFLNYSDRAHLQGTHSRLHHPPEGILIGTRKPQLKAGSSQLEARSSKIYVASIDLAGEIETSGDDISKILHPKKDSTVITIAELTFSSDPIPSPDSQLETDCSSSFPSSRPEESEARREDLARNSKLETRSSKLEARISPVLHIVEHYVWTGITHTALYSQMVDLLKNTWRCSTIVIDATGMGGPIASAFISDFGKKHAFPFTFTPKSKSELGFNLLAYIKSGRLKMYAADNSPEYKEFWHQMERAKSVYRPNQTLNFFVDPSDGHDDFLMSLALLVEAPALYQEPRIAFGR